MAGHGDTKSSVVLASGAGESRVVINADLRVVFQEFDQFCQGAATHLRIRIQQTDVIRTAQLIGAADTEVIAVGETPVYRCKHQRYPG